MRKNKLSTIEAAKALGITRQAVLKKIKEGKIKAEKVGRNYVINKADLPIRFGGELTEEKKSVIDRAIYSTSLTDNSFIFIPYQATAKFRHTVR